jgi:hypothetical protein
MFYGRENIGLPGGSLKDMAGTRRLELLTSTVSKLVNLTCKKFNMNELLNAGAGRGGRTPMTRRSADFESAASASSAIPAR